MSPYTPTTSVLLATRLHVPALSSRHVARPALLERLDAGIADGRRLTLISASPGFGKTMLVSEWLKQHDRAAAWVSLDEGDNDPIQFLRYFAAGVQQQHPDALLPISDLLNSPQLPPPVVLGSMLINELSALPFPLTLVLDDYHRIDEPAVHELVRRLIEHLPPRVHMVIVTREDPPLLLHQLRAQGMMTEIRQRDLRFDRDQVAVYLSRAAGVALTEAEVAALEARTEGWVTGLQLAALAIQERPENAAEFIAQFTGGDRYITDYLVAEVLHRLPEAYARFLRSTSVLTQFTADLCDELTGQRDSADILAFLENANVFLVPLDRQRSWYRYHHLFADVLRASLSRAEEASLHAVARDWYETRGMYSDAWFHVREILRLTGDGAGCVRLIKRAADQWFEQGAVATLSQWLAVLPPESHDSDPELWVVAGWTAALQGDFRGAIAALESAKGRIDETHAALYGRVLSLEAFCCLFVHRNYEAVTALVSRALMHLEARQPNWRALTAWLGAEAARRAGNLEVAVAELRRLEQSGLIRQRSFFALVVASGLISCLYLRGELTEALTVCESLIARFVEHAGEGSPLLGVAWAWLGRLCYERNDLGKAQVYLDRGVEQSNALGMEIYRLLAHGYRSLLLRARGDTKGAIDDLERASALTTRTQFADVTWFAAWRTNIHIREGDLEAAERWLATVELEPRQRLDPMRIEAYLTLVRLRIAQEAYDDASQWLTRLDEMENAAQFLRTRITVLLLQASIAERQGRRTLLHYLAEAVRLASPEGFIRPFLDEDARLLPYLPRVRDAAPVFVDRIINAAMPSEDPDALTERELEVLRLLAVGLSTGDIAGRLMIAPGTAKRHLHHIYEKLAVGSRVQAVNRARALKLID